ncbi:MAG: NUDIX hydrolase [Anaerolineaceae bacterium]|nr:NUDIX hydrolase [Anaerolineaceae bacterium]
MTVEILDREECYQGRAFQVQRVRMRMPNGREPRYDLVIHPGAAVILPVDDAGRILFVRQYRLGAEQELLELPAGTLEDGEPPLECARREVREETGMAAREMVFLGDFYLTPGYSNEHLYIYLARGLYGAALDQDDDEFIDLVPIAAAEAYQMAARGEIRDGKTLAALLLAQSALGQ